jgi:hypothetical protein
MGDYKANQMESGSTGKDHQRLDNEHECRESENKWHGKIVPDEKHGDNRCI